jgi:hypothetical protein
MPNRWPINSGSWSDSAIWSGSLIPNAADDVFLNNQTVTLDQTIIVRSINNTATGSAIAGGRLNIFSDYNITATPTGIRSDGATVTGGYIKYYNTGSISIIATFLQTRNTLENVNSGTVNITGEVRQPAITSTGFVTITNSSTGIINILGNITCPSNSNLQNYGVLNASSGIINIVGNITAGIYQQLCHAVVNNSNGTVNVTGNITGGSVGATSGFGVANVSTGIVNITGNINGGSAATCHGVNNASIGTINITGNITGGTSTAVGINSTTAGIINVIGQLQATTLNNAVSSTSTTATNVFSGPFINSGSRNAIYCYNVRLYDDNTTRYTIGVSGSTDTISLLSPDQVTGVPSGSDVRFGTTYGPGSELTGSMQVPNPQSVSVGVAVDNTVGTAIANPEDLWNYAITSLTASNSIGQRLANTSTSASNAAIINAFG